MTMATTLRLKKEEQRDAELKCRKLNKKLVNAENKPISESELLHAIIEQGLLTVDVDEKGNILLG